MGIKIADVNEPCHCGSGLKLIECHLKPSFPNEYFSVKITKQTEDHFVGYKDGKYEKIPGRIMMKISVINPEFVYEDIINLLKPLREIKNIESIRLPRFDKIIRELHLEDNIDSTISWGNRINKLQHKLESIKYHMNSFSKHEKEDEDKCKKEYTNTIVELEKIDPVYVYETEAFLFQTKSALDIIAHIIGMSYKLTGVVTYDGKDLIDKINKSSAFRQNEYNKKGIIEILKSNESWIKNFVNMRDLVTHYSDLIGFKSVIHSPTTENDNYANIYYPSMPNKERVTTFMNNIWINLADLINNISKVICNLHNKRE